ncbi:hypothetical protein AB870_24545 (plasmid) [Pandoraea faecigallinarum]|uniref:Uncharacterized protein n=1 Tax=Pandoraea faecigallinarum TaxID=656179 RepID=A0A0H3X331_9BURK|nr:hypothetical protein AB870_24545 [Pandoraea faecigallinarum]
MNIPPYVPPVWEVPGDTMKVVAFAFPAPPNTPAALHSMSNNKRGGILRLAPNVRVPNLRRKVILFMAFFS